MAAAGPKVMVPLRHAVRPPCDGSRSPRNHQPFLCPLGFPPCPTVMPHGCRSSEVPLQLSLATCRPTLLRHCPQACVCVPCPGVFPALIPAWLGIRTLWGNAVPLPPSPGDSQPRDALGCQLARCSRIRPLSPQCPEEGEISLRWHHGQARMYQPRQLCAAYPKPHHHPRPLPVLPSPPAPAQP